MLHLRRAAAASLANAGRVHTLRATPAALTQPVRCFQLGGPFRFISVPALLASFANVVKGPFVDWVKDIVKTTPKFVLGHEFHVRILGSKQGQFSGEITPPLGHEGVMGGIAFKCDVNCNSAGGAEGESAGAGAASGPGTPRYKPISFVKECGAATPQLLAALETQEPLELIDFLRVGLEGLSRGRTEEVYLTMELRAARLVAIRQAPAPPRPAPPGPSHPALSSSTRTTGPRTGGTTWRAAPRLAARAGLRRGLAQEEVALVARSVRLVNHQTGTEFTAEARAPRPAPPRPAPPHLRALPTPTRCPPSAGRPARSASIPRSV
eukprot:tig00001335_g8209.t1